ncbi:MAG: peptidoglycan DD-metalloendopeptidase family protein [Cytophagales bacterium]|jgi:murein DD-endopeptidase MepM/ murein hydrolase activator NlpD|nr:peptidoglycan DD-metalloendopeptidase family protein [Cytophagales bacterium]
MYYFDDKTGKYKKYNKISFSTIFPTIIFCCLFSFFVYREKKSEITQLENLKNENVKLLEAFEVINEELKKNRKLFDELKSRDRVIYRSILLPESAQQDNFKLKKVSNERYEINLQSNNEIINEVKNSLEEFNYELVKQERIFKDLQKMAIIKKNVWASIPAILPVKNGRATSGFGSRMHPIYKTIRKHSGLDISNKIGTPIIATGDGVVSKVDSDKKSGIYVRINHGFGFETVYAHLNSTNIKRGMRVKRGQVIGRMGNTGISTGSHVHYEVKKNGKFVNPISYIAIDITPKEYEEIMRINNSKTMSMD